MLADEAPIAAFRAEARITAGEALCKEQQFLFALEQFERGLAIEPHNLRGLQKKGICLQRSALASFPHHSLDLARAHYREVLKTVPNDPETWALLGRVDKDAWIAVWHQSDKTPEQMKDEAAYEDALLRAAIEGYTSAYGRIPVITILALMQSPSDASPSPSDKRCAVREGNGQDGWSGSICGRDGIGP